MKTAYYGPQRIGPEVEIENYVACNISKVFEGLERPIWAGVSLTIGGGKPDIIVVSYRPEVINLSGAHSIDIKTLPFLKQVGWVRLETVFEKLSGTKKELYDSIMRLAELGVIEAHERSFKLKREWRDILPYILVVEAKVDKWRKGLEQASRNTIYSHRSFLALPYETAFRVSLDNSVKKSRIGVLAVDLKKGLFVAKPGPLNKPRVWKYYFDIAYEVAKDLGK